MVMRTGRRDPARAGVEAAVVPASANVRRPAPTRTTTTMTAAPAAGASGSGSSGPPVEMVRDASGARRPRTGARRGQAGAVTRAGTRAGTKATTGAVRDSAGPRPSQTPGARYPTVGENPSESDRL